MLVGYAQLCYVPLRTCSCKQSLCKILKTISNFYNLNNGKTYPSRLANILINNYCQLYSTKSFQKRREQKVKLATN